MHRSSKLLWLAAAFSMFAAFSAPSAAEAQRRAVDIGTPHTGDRPFQLDIHGGFTPWGVGAATGARFGIPLLANGFIPSINNAVYLNFGVDFYWMRYRWRDDGRGNRHWNYGAGFGFPITLHWEFYFNENWSAFAEIGANVFLHPNLFYDDRHFHASWEHWFIAQVGGRFHINEWFALTLRVGSPYFSFGVTFLL